MGEKLGGDGEDMKGLVIIEGREEYERFVKECVVIKSSGFDDVTYMGMTVMWISDLSQAIAKLKELIMKG